ncbi:TPA: hypothetical protein ACGD8A_004765 [Serratia marcescens]
MDSIKQKLLGKVSRMELAASRGLQINTEFAPSLEKGSVISAEACNATLKDCQLFRKWINEFFESSE